MAKSEHSYPIVTGLLITTMSCSKQWRVSRDYEKKRTSETADEMYSDASVLSASRQQSQILREEIRRAMALKAPGEFEDLIRLYFRALAEEATMGRSGE